MDTPKRFIVIIQNLTIQRITGDSNTLNQGDGNDLTNISKLIEELENLGESIDIAEDKDD